MNTITASRRDPAAKAKQLRRSGIIPCVIYGMDLPASISAQIDEGTARLLRRTARNGSKVRVRLDEDSYPTLIKDMVYDSVKNEVVHIGFQVLSKGKKVNSVADIVLINKDKVAGVLEQMQVQVAHAAMPEHLIDTVTVDLEDMPIGTVVTVGDIPEFRSENIELLTDPDNLVYRISEKKRAAPKQEEQTEE